MRANSIPWQAAVALLASLFLAAAACTGGQSAIGPTSTPSSTETQRETASANTCPNPHGGVCLGPLAAGTYETTSFLPSIKYTVPDGWVNLEDLPGNFLLVRAEDPQEGIFGGNFVGIYRDVLVAAENCDETWEPGVGRSPQALAESLTGRPGIATSDPEPVSVGGLRGLVLDVTLEKKWKGTCPFSEGLPVVPLIIGSGVSHLHHVVLPGMSERLYLLAAGDGNVVIEVGHVPGQGTFTEYLAAVEPIVKSIVFGAP